MKLKRVTITIPESRRDILEKTAGAIDAYNAREFDKLPKRQLTGYRLPDLQEFQGLKLFIAKEKGYWESYEIHSGMAVGPHSWNWEFTRKTRTDTIEILKRYLDGRDMQVPKSFLPYLKEVSAPNYTPPTWKTAAQLCLL